MDRWSNADDPLEGLPGKGRVARLGIGGFVKSAQATMGAPDAQIQGAMEVIPSRLEQQKLRKEARMPPPTSRAAGPTSGITFKAPEWATNPMRTAVLEVHKEGQKIQEIELNKKAILFGRNVTTDVVLEHPSASRQHAAICFRGDDHQWVLMDLGSVHGTLCNGQRVQQGAPVVLQHEAQLRFGASSRTYIVKKRGADEGKKGLKRSNTQRREGCDGQPKRVRFADGPSGEPLEKIIGYSDGGAFSANVGPRQISQEEKGQFQELVTSSTSLKSDREQNDNAEEKQLKKKDSGPKASAPKLPSALKSLVETGSKQPGTRPQGAQSRRGGLYDSIPPPSDHATKESSQEGESTEPQGNG